MKKSFTLVELMIVIAILAILSAIVIFALNPTELFKKSRDSRRLADMNSLYKAITFMESGNTSGLDIGTSTVIYLSLPDTSSTCSTYSLPTLPSGFSYNCVTEANLRNTNGNGGIPIDFAITDDNQYFASLPIDPTNNINYYYSYNPGGSFEVNAFLESTDRINAYAVNDGGDSMNALELGTNLFDMPQAFPHNGIKVPGNPLYSTNDFGVMQYEAKYSIDGKTGSDATTDCKNNVSYDTYDGGKACTYTANNMNNVVSSPLGSPIAAVTHTEAKAICTALGAHLITNPEGMTIARNIDQQALNGTSGIVGTGYLFNGNSGDATRGYNGADPEKGFNRNIRASHILSNGNRIYDFSGNVGEHAMLDINDTLLNTLPNDGGATGGRGVELTALTTYGDFTSYDDLKPTDSSWDADQGMGRIYTNSALQSSRVLLRGGCWSNASYTGSFALHLSLSTSSADYPFGFRCAR